MAESGLGTARQKISETSPNRTYPETTTSNAPDQFVGAPAIQSEATLVATQGESGLAVNWTAQKVRRTSRRFFAVACVSLMEAVFFIPGNPLLAAACGAIAVVFGVLGAFASRLNKTAALSAMILFAAETVQLIVYGWTATMIVVAYAVLMHCAILYRLYLTYDTLGESKAA